MSPSDLQERETLAAGTRSMGLNLDDTQIDRLLGYLDLLLQWNKVYNLTAIRDRRHALTHHLLDSLSVLPPLQRHIGSLGISQPISLLDVGSGGGLPGVVLAIVMPSLTVTCVDTVAKKAGFIRQAGVELGLPNLHARHSRVEDLSGVAFDVITSRAFSSLPDLIHLTRTLLKGTGVWMAMKGQFPQAEIDALPADTQVFHVEPLHVPGLDAERCLVWIQPRT